MWCQQEEEGEIFDQLVCLVWFGVEEKMIVCARSLLTFFVLLNLVVLFCFVLSDKEEDGEREGKEKKERKKK